ncbi:MAG TPA: hypothetical protein VF086_10775 [Propionibacteriaceae bacterium]
MTTSSDHKGFVSDDEFANVMLPGTRALDALANTFISMNERHGYIAAASSRAMAEIAAEARFASEAWPEPAHNAHTMVGMLNRAGVDHAASFAHLFSSAPIPVYAHLVIARAAMEAFAWAYWLGDPNIGVELRIKRSKVWQLADAQQLRRLRMDELVMRSKRLKARVRRGAPKGWTIVCNDKTISVDGETKPTTTQAISAVLRIDPKASLTGGGPLWGYLSGVVHASQYALISSMEPDTAAEEIELGPYLAATVTGSDRVHFIAANICRAAINACDAEVSLLGWDHDPAWQTAVNNAAAYIQAVIQSTAPRA